MCRYFFRFSQNLCACLLFSLLLLVARSLVPRKNPNFCWKIIYTLEFFFLEVHIKLIKPRKVRIHPKRMDKPLFTMKLWGKVISRIERLSIFRKINLQECISCSIDYIEKQNEDFQENYPNFWMYTACIRNKMTALFLKV